MICSILFHMFFHCFCKCVFFEICMFYLLFCVRAVDDTIRESLNQVNTDYPIVDSPAKLGVDMPDKSTSEIAADAPIDAPLFDRTPMVLRSGGFDSSAPVFDRTPLNLQSDGAESSVPVNYSTPLFPQAHGGDDISGADGERTTGPIFDPTPMHIVSNEQLPVTSAHSSECTPEWQDTPSQTVDGTEEVTQEHNVQEQLDKYQQEHMARVDIFNEKLNQDRKSVV